MTRRLHGTSWTPVGQRQTGTICYWLHLCSSIAILIVLLAAPGWAKISNVFGDLVRGTARVTEELPLRHAEDLVAQLPKSKAVRDVVTRELQQSGKLLDKADDAAKLATRSRAVLQWLGQATAHLNPSVMHRLEQLDDVSRESALILAKGGKHLSETLPDISRRAHLLREGGAPTVAAIGLHGPEAAHAATWVDEAIKGGALTIPQGQRAVTLADFGMTMTKSGETSWRFWKTYVQPHPKLWLASGALAVYLLNPEAFQDAVGGLTEAGFEHLTQLGGRVSADAIRGIGKGSVQAGQDIGNAVKETYLSGLHGILAAIGTILVLCAALGMFRRIRSYVLRPFAWLNHVPQAAKTTQPRTITNPE
jgi:hypothetical protein